MIPPTTTIAASATSATKVYGSGDDAVYALRDVSVDFYEGQFTAIMGPSGSGKSTLMHCIAGLDELSSGSAIIDGIDLSSLKDKELTELRRLCCFPTSTEGEYFHPQSKSVQGCTTEIQSQFFRDVAR